MGRNRIPAGWIRTALARARPYLQAMPVILLLQIATTIMLVAAIFAFGAAARELFAVGKSVTDAAGSYGSALRAIGGWILLAALLAVVLAALGIDLCAKTAFAGQMVRGHRLSISQAFADAVRALPRFLTPAGTAILAYVAAVVPVLGVGITLSFAEKLPLPAFLGVLLGSKSLCLAIYTLVVAAFAALGFFGILTFQGIVLHAETPREAFVRSRRLMGRNWPRFLLSTARFALWNLVLTLPVWLATFGLPIAVAFREGLGAATPSPEAFWIMLASLAGAAVSILLASFTSPFMAIKLTQLHESFSRGTTVTIPAQNTPAWLWPAALGVVAASVLALFGAARTGIASFDDLFPATPGTRIVADERGTDTARASPESLRKNAAEGADGVLLSLRLAKDGRYVAGDDADFDDMLAAARDEGLMVFVELDATADTPTAVDGAIALADEAGMLSRCVFVSSSYEVIAGVAANRPAAATGYTAFAAYADAASLQASWLLLEELAATGDTLLTVKALDKKAAVWTVDSRRSLRRLLDFDVDALITSDVAASARARDALASRTRLERIADRVIMFF